MTGAANSLNISESGVVTFDGINQFFGRTLTAGAGITITNGDGISANPVIATNGANDLHVATYIVNPNGPNNGTGANYSTIGSAVAAVQASGKNGTIFIMPGTYTENLTLTNGINIVAFEADAYTPNVTIIGKILLASGGTCSLSGLRLQTNSDFVLSTTGSTNCTIYLKNCYLLVSNHTAINISTSGSNVGGFILFECRWDIPTTGVALFSATGSTSSNLQIYNCIGGNSGGSTTASTISHGTLTIQNSFFNHPITTSSDSIFISDYLKIDCSPTNTTSLTLGGSGSQIVRHASISSGTASALNISTTATLNFCDINSSNTNAITGSGTLIDGGINYMGTSQTTNITTYSNTFLNRVVDQTGSTVNILTNNCYINDRAGGVTYTLPTSAYLGDWIEIVGKSGSWSIMQNANQQIIMGVAFTTVGITGHMDSTNANDCIKMRCTTAGTSTVWTVISSIGTISFT